MSGHPTDAGTYAAFSVVVVGASAGGIQALLPLLQNLPSNFSCPIIVVFHLPPASQFASVLPAVFQRRTSLQVKWAQDKESLLPGVVYVAPQDSRTDIDPQTGCLRVSPTTLSRPKALPVDVLFLSAAQVFGRRSLAIVLSGVLSDGAAGAAGITVAEGLVLTQIGSEAEFGDMPQAAMQSSPGSMALDSIALAAAMSRLVMVPGAAEQFCREHSAQRKSPRPPN